MSRIRHVSAFWLLGLLLVACGEDLAGPETGAIEVTSVTAGDSPDPDGYSASLDGAPGRPIGSNGTITFTGLIAGNHTVGLTGIAPNCTVGGENPRTVTVTNGGAAPAVFQVSCFATGEGIILFTSDRTGTSHLYSMREDGSRIVDLTPSDEACCGDWSPDGKRIVFEAEAGISVMNQDGSSPVGLGVAGGGPRWSPDGRKILFVSDGTIQVINADGSQVVALTTGSQPEWSPDGTRIAFDRIDRSRCLADLFCPADIYVMAADGSQVRKVTNASNASDQSRGPGWSPDGTTIAYTRRCCFLGPNQNGLWVISPNGGSPKRIDGRAATGRPVWSPDGSAIAFGADQLNSTTELTVIPSGGGAGIVLASSPGSEFPSSWK